MAYKFFNPSPKYRVGQKWHKGDCSVRAISAVTGMTWVESYKLLCESGLHVYNEPASAEAIDFALKKLGFERFSVKKLPGFDKYRPTVEQLCQIESKGNVFALIQGHAVGIKDGDYYDVWDCGNSKVTRYYKTKK